MTRVLKMTRLKKLSRKPAVPMGSLLNGQDLDDSSPADLRQVIDELEAAIAEHEATNAFLRDLLEQQWFDADLENLEDSHALERL